MKGCRQDSIPGSLDSDSMLEDLDLPVTDFPGPQAGRTGRDPGRSGNREGSILDRGKESSRLRDLFIDLALANSVSDIARILSEGLPELIHFEVGSLRWRSIDGDEEDLSGESCDEEFTEMVEFSSGRRICVGIEPMPLDLEGPDSIHDSWHGGIERIYRARSEDGDTLIVNLHSAFVIPLYCRKTRVGILSLYSSRKGDFKKVDSDKLGQLWELLGQVLGRTLDLQSREKKVERYRSLLDSSNNIMVQWKCDGTVWEVDYNRRAEAFITGSEEGLEAVDGPFFVRDYEERRRATDAWKRAFETGHKRTVDLRLIDDSGTSRMFICTFSPINDNDMIKGVSMTGIESEEVDSALASMERTLEAYRLTLSVVSHDLKNPLSTISGYAELLNLEAPLAKSDHLKKIVQATKRMDNTIHMAKIMAQLEEGEVEGDFIHINLKLMLSNCLDQLYPRTRQHEVRFSLPERDFKIMGHPLLEHVLTNLLDNSLKYSPEGSPITISLDTSVTGITISIADLGEGVPDEFKEAIFNRFRRLDSKSGIRGTGLGLAISRGIVDIHQGRIWVEDNLPAGSVFKVYLPWDPNQ